MPEYKSPLFANTKLVERGQKLSKFEKRFDDSFSKELNKITPCSDLVAYRILEQLQKNIENFVFELGRKQEGVNNACEELFRLILVREANYSDEELFAFVCWYEELDDALSFVFDDIDLERGDDSFGDLCDALPLAGKEVIEGCKAKKYKSCKKLEKAVSEAVAGKFQKEWTDFILEGENYLSTALRDAAKGYAIGQIANGTIFK